MTCSGSVFYSKSNENPSSVQNLLVGDRHRLPGSVTVLFREYCLAFVPYLYSCASCVAAASKQHNGCQKYFK
jgi:hypothetical protein